MFAGRSLERVSAASIGAASRCVVLALLGVALLAGCGDDDSSGAARTPTAPPAPTVTATPLATPELVKLATLFVNRSREPEASTPSAHSLVSVTLLTRESLTESSCHHLA